MNVFILSEKQKEDINLGRQQIAEGDYISNEELEEEEEKWLNE